MQAQRVQLQATHR